MSKNAIHPLPADVVIDPKTGKKNWTVGTLRYTKGGLLILFAWLVWNDVFLMLMEAIKPSLSGILLRSHGASNTEIAFYLGTLGTAFTFWINPVASTWSDRTRTRWGRRRPFLLICTPPMVLTLALIPWAPEIWTWIASQPFLAGYFQPGSNTGAVVAISFCFILSGLFNNFILAIFSLFFLDVVPKSVLGRFNAILRIATTIQSFVWNYWLFGLAENNMKWIYGGLAIACATCYMISLLAVKEGDYPPPEPLAKSDAKWYERIFGPVRLYIKDCYCKPYYLWIFVACMVFQISNVANIFRLFHWKETLGFSMDTIGKMQAWPHIALAVVGYLLGSMVDRFKSLRMMPIALAMWACTNVLAFFLLRTPTMLLVCMGLIELSYFIFSISWGVMNTELFPREKMGQFCSANTLLSTVVVALLNPVAGKFFDWVNNYQYAYAWSAAWQFAALILFIKVYYNWQNKLKAEAASGAHAQTEQLAQH